MSVHFISSFATGVGREAPERLSEALARAGRQVESRQVLAVDEQPRPQTRGTLRWRVVELVDHGGTVLFLDEPPEAHQWDLGFCRALSEVTEGFVVARDSYRSGDRRALATFLSGRTVELASWDLACGDVHVGAPPIDDLLAGLDVDELYTERLIHLCGGSQADIDQGEVLASEEWRVSLPRDSELFLERELPTSRMVLARVEERAWREHGVPLLPRGWRWRASRTPKQGQDYIELAHDGAMAPALVAQLSRALSCAAMGVEISGGGRPSQWAEARQGELERRGEEAGALPLIQVFGRLSLLMDEGPGMISGHGNQGWNQSEK